jgi:WhiB family redox-sensing transcriptional regulator
MRADATMTATMTAPSAAFLTDEARACLGLPVDWFYPEIGASTTQIDRAKRVCSRCPVQAACLAYALATREPHGIWGGKSVRERRAILGRTRHRRHEVKGR